MSFRCSQRGAIVCNINMKINNFIAVLTTPYALWNTDIAWLFPIVTALYAIKVPKATIHAVIFFSIVIWREERTIIAIAEKTPQSPTRLYAGPNEMKIIHKYNNILSTKFLHKYVKCQR